MSRRAFIQTTIDSIDITGDVSGDVLSVSYTEHASEEADDISISLQNRSKRWLYNWYPQEGAELTNKIITQRWTGRLNCGKFIIDDVSVSGGSGSGLLADIKAIAMPVNEAFSGTPHNKTWSQATINEVASYIAGKNGIPLLYTASYDATIDFISQTDTNDKAFLYDLCQKYGLTMKLFSNRIVIYDMMEMENSGTVRTLYPEDFTDWTGHSTITDTGYTACTVKYTIKDGETLEYTYSIEGKTQKTYEHTTQVDNLAEAQRVAKAKLHELNAGQTTLSANMPGNTGMVSAICVKLKGFGYYNGKYFIDRSTHSIDGGGGYKTSIEMHKVVPYD